MNATDLAVLCNNAISSLANPEYARNQKRIREDTRHNRGDSKKDNRTKRSRSQVNRVKAAPTVEQKARIKIKCNTMKIKKLRNKVKEGRALVVQVAKSKQPSIKNVLAALASPEMREEMTEKPWNFQPGLIDNLPNLKGRDLINAYVISAASEECRLSSGKKKKTAALNIVSSLETISEQLYTDISSKRMTKLFNRTVKTTILSAPRLAQAMDKNNRNSLTLSGIEVLSGLGKDLIPSRQTVQICNYNVQEGYAENHGVVVSDDHMMVQADISDVFEEVIRSANVSSTGQRGITTEDKDRGAIPLHAIEIDGTSDGAKMTEHKGMILAGIKIIDKAINTLIHKDIFCLPSNAPPKPFGYDLLNHDFEEEDNCEEYTLAYDEREGTFLIINFM